MNKGQNYYGGGGTYGNKFQMGSGNGPAGRDDNRMLVWEATRMLQESFLSHDADMPRLLELAHSLAQHLETTRSQYNRAVGERDAAYRRLQEANNKLSQVENLVKRYAVVREPVIASDGYTYERESITKYLDECSSGNSKAYSQQTKEELTDVTVPNKSLNRLVTHLKEVRPIEMPPPSQRGPIPVFPGGTMPPRTVWADEDLGGGGAGVGAPVRPMPVPLDANLSPAASGVGQTSVGSGATIGGITVPAPASASMNAAGGGGGGRSGGRFDGGKMRSGGGGGASGARPALHPCLRVYGFCNFMDDCTFANYPFEACLNHIKGKCRFGQNCKELHVDPRDPHYQNARSYANQHGHGGNNGGNNNNNNSAAHQRSAHADPEEDKAENEEKPSNATGDSGSEATAAASKSTEESKSDKRSDKKKSEKEEKASNESAKAEEEAAEAAAGSSEAKEKSA